MVAAAVFLDKDGTLVENIPYNVDPARIRLARGALPALRRMASAGYELVVVSNQSGIARGVFAESALADVEERLQELVSPAGIRFAGFYWCPHHPEGVLPRYSIACDCRKPAPGLLRRAAHDLGLDLQASWMVGDILNDVEAGRRAGCRVVLVDNGGETEWVRSPIRDPDFIVSNLKQAAAIICGERGGVRESESPTVQESGEVSH